MSSSVTPGSSRAAGSTSRGTATSTISRSVPPRRVMTVLMSLCSQHDVSGASGGDDHIGCDQFRLQPVEAHHSPAACLCGRRGPVRCAVGHCDVHRAGAGQRLECAGGHVPGAQHQHSPRREGAETLLGQRHGGMGQRRDALRDAGSGPDLLAGLHRPAEQRIEHRAHGALALCGLPGIPDLAQYLVLAHHHRVEPGRHAEQVPHRFGVVKGVELVGDGLGRQSRVLGEHFADVGVTTVEALGVGVDLGAVAG